MRHHCINQLLIGQPRIIQTQFTKNRFFAAHHLAHAQARVRNQLNQLRARRWIFEVFDDDGFKTCMAYHRQGIARGAAFGVVINRDVHVVS